MDNKIVYDTLDIVTAKCKEETKKNERLQSQIAELEKKANEKDIIVEKLEEEKKRLNSQIAKLEKEGKKRDRTQSHVPIGRRVISRSDDEEDDEEAEGSASIGRPSSSAHLHSDNTVSDDLPTFDGEQALSVGEWTDRVNAILSASNDGQRVNLVDKAALALRGPALEWYKTSWNSKSQAQARWRAFCKALSARFGIAQDDEDDVEGPDPPIESSERGEDDLDSDFTPDSEDDSTEADTERSAKQVRRSPTEKRPTNARIVNQQSHARRRRAPSAVLNGTRTNLQKTRMEEVLKFEETSSGMLLDALASLDNQIKCQTEVITKGTDTRQSDAQAPCALPDSSKESKRKERTLLGALTKRMSEGEERLRSVRWLDVIMYASKPLYNAVHASLEQMGTIKSYQRFSKGLISSFKQSAFSPAEEHLHRSELHERFPCKGEYFGKNSTVAQKQNNEQAQDPNGAAVSAEPVQREKTFASIVNLAVFVVERVLLYDKYPPHMIKVPHSLVKDIRRLFSCKDATQWSWTPVLYPVQARSNRFAKAFKNFAQSETHYRHCERMGTQVVWLVRDIILQAILPRWYIAYGTMAISLSNNIADLTQEDNYSALLSDTYTNLAERTETSRRLLMNSKSLNCAYRPFIRTSSTFFCPENGPGGTGTSVGAYVVKDAESEDDMCFVQTRLYAWIRLYTQYIWFKNGVFDLALVDGLFVYAVEAGALPDLMSCFRGQADLKNKTWCGELTPAFFYGKEQQEAQEAFLLQIRQVAKEKGIDVCFFERIQAILKAQERKKEKSKENGKEKSMVMKRGMQGEQEACRKKSRPSIEPVELGTKGISIDLTADDL